MIIKKSLIMILAVLSTFGKLGTVHAIDLDDIKDHIVEHKVAYAGTGGALIVTTLSVILYKTMGSQTAEKVQLTSYIGEDDEDDEDDIDDVVYSKLNIK